MFKFGGTSVGTADALRAVSERIARAGPNLVVVVSAMNGVTDLLLAAGRAAVRGDVDVVAQAGRTFGERHHDLADRTLVAARSLHEIKALIDESARELAEICRSVATLRELTPRTSDLLVSRGERLLARIVVATLAERGVAAVYVDATEVIAAVERLGARWPDVARCEANALAKLKPHLARGETVVMPGFIALGQDGAVVTLGRGGSDLSATVVAEALGADGVYLFKDVDGLMTADPKLVSDARVLDRLHYREAAELAYYGAKVLHPRALFPLVRKNIPLVVRNTFNDGFPGTRISGEISPDAFPVKALTTIPEQALIAVEGNGMLGVPGVAARTFEVVRAAGHSVVMISQASSESSICFVVPQGEATEVVRVLEEAFAAERTLGLIDAIRSEPDVALVAIVGLGMRGTPGIAARAFGAMREADVNVLAIAQGSSELNITVAMRQGDASRAVKALHHEFKLDKIRRLPTGAPEHGVSVAVLGFGQIGQALALQIAQQDRYFRYELGQPVTVVAVGDTSGVKMCEAGFTPDGLIDLVAAKRAGGPADGVAASLEQTAARLGEQVWPLAFARPILVDVTASDSFALLLDAVEHGFNLVLANKKPVAQSQRQYAELFAAARRRGVSIKHGATVGGGLPVLDTLAKLRASGDRVRLVEGSLSGTLGFVLTKVEDGVAFAEAVRQAQVLGYTEPDPRDDLSGLDVARKALILARALGRSLEPADVQLSPLCPEAIALGEPATFLARLRRFDDEMARRVQLAAQSGKVLRYLARIGPDVVSVGLAEVAAAAPLGRLRGTDNQVVFHTDRYDTNPLVVTGPGAGAEVTAAGVLNDLVAIAGGAARGRGEDS